MPVSSTPPLAIKGNSEQTNGAALALVTMLFFMWGFLTVLNDILVPHFKAIFELNYAKVMLIQFTFFMAYVLLAVPVGKIVDWIGYQGSMVLGLCIMGTGALLFLPAAIVASYGVFLFALFVLAGGMTILQVSCNPYVTVLGPPETASSRLNLAQAFNSLGTAIAPWLGGVLILSNTARTADEVRAMPPETLAAFRLAEAASVKLPYLLFAAVLFGLAIVMWRVRLPVLGSIESSGEYPVINGKEVRSAWKARHLVLGAVGIGLYCGAEVSIGSFLVNFFAQPEIGGLSEKIGSRYVSYYWTGAMLGRFAGVWLTRWIPAGRLLGIFAMVASVLVWACIFSTGTMAMWAIILVGLFNSIMFPNIFALAIEGLGRLTSQGAGILFLGVVGPALLPLAQGALADHIGIHQAFVIPAICYLYVVYYGFRGCRH